MINTKLLLLGSAVQAQAIHSLFPQLQHCATEKELFAEIQKRYPHIIFIEDLNPQQTILCTSKIRSSFSEADIPIVILSAHDWTTTQKDSLSLLNQSYRLSTSLPSDQIKNQVDLLLDMNYFDRSDERCHLHALGLLIQIFREDKNGELGNPNRSIPIRDGGVVSYNAEEELILFLQEDQPFFSQTNDSGLGDWLLVMDMIWKELSKFVMPGFLSQRKNLGISVSTKNDKLFALPLHNKTIQFLFETDPQHAIIERLKTLQLAQSEIESDIEMLYRMGFCRFVLLNHTPSPSVSLEIIEVEDEEQGWSVLEHLRPTQSIRLPKASGHFWQAVLQKEQYQTNTSNNIIKALQKQDPSTAYTLLFLQKQEISTWEDLALISWIQLQLYPTDESCLANLKWIHQQNPTITSALFLAVLYSEKQSFEKAHKLVDYIQSITNHPTKYTVLHKILLRTMPLPRSIIYRLL